jgi:DNA-binding NtrC family response regulator
MPFQVVDCGALSPILIERELFGHARGAFAGADRDRPGKCASAGRGTLLLDEINALPPALQANVLRAIDERGFVPLGATERLPLEARIVAVSNVELEADVEAGRFSADLFARLNAAGFYLPPLRSRRTSILPLCRQFVAEFAARGRPDVGGMTADALTALHEYHWPGNVRQLRNVIERAVARCQGPAVELADLPEAIRLAAGVPHDLD